VAAYKRGDFATAPREFRPLAEQGDALAQFTLGLMYGEGRGVPKDDAEAVQFGYVRSGFEGYLENVGLIGDYG